MPVKNQTPIETQINPDSQAGKSSFGCMDEKMINKVREKPFQNGTKMTFIT